MQPSPPHAQPNFLSFLRGRLAEAHGRLASINATFEREKARSLAAGYKDPPHWATARKKQAEIDTGLFQGRIQEIEHETDPAE